jgi:hypothetical protein
VFVKVEDFDELRKVLALCDQHAPRGFPYPRRGARDWG